MLLRAEKRGLLPFGVNQHGSMSQDCRQVILPVGGTLSSFPYLVTVAVPYGEVGIPLVTESRFAFSAVR